MADGSGVTIPAVSAISDSSAAAVQNITDVHQRYAAEREKRLRPDGLAQYIDVAQSDRFRHYQDDPWVDHAALNAQEAPLQDGSRTKILILGAGWSGLLFAVRLLEAGVGGADIRIVDSAGGFGGTWYWNRYPGLNCDIESYIYMPLLEELGYMPRDKYAFGPELREHADRIADHYGLRDKAAFRTEVKGMDWVESEKVWRVAMVQKRGPGDDENCDITVHAQFVFSASGVLNYPKVPKFAGLDAYKGHIFHTSRWDYNYTGGSPTEASLNNLKNKRVGIIGTGATAIQCVPRLAESAKELFVFQRTPAAVDVRGNRPTNPEQWATTIAAGEGWQAARRWNFLQHISNTTPRPAVDMVDDGWSHAPSISALFGAPGKGILQTPEAIGAHVTALHALDMERQERIRAHVDVVVADKATAAKLKAWYPTWCKRPTFHDEYLPTFNRPNVTLVDTDGKGVERLSEHGVIANGKEYELDCLILSTGFRSPFVGPAGLAGMVVKGRDGRSLDAKWAEGVATLHGVCSHDFPNLFWPGPSQAALDGSYAHSADQLARHVAYIVTEALKRGGDDVVVEATADAEEAWTMQIVARAAGFAATAGCTPSYYNGEGALDRIASDAERLKAARGAPYGDGFESYVKVIESWRREGGMEGLVLS
ncbi:hypothetical protein LTR36_007801 [Oleoguttula mirabilis]|uniref:Uncharacterized protein n=1 Tax=Oleoguttula mirabilis TaxID=1507867 RepID=A0AAV9JA67_9PEZI|nr:hypothetical protein LTR36_007801 [Oleoguttula mirabilis]